MAYYVNKTNGTAIVVLDGTKDNTSTSLTLIGRLATNYGEIQNENFVRLLENFALSTSPAYPITGQLWYDTATKSIKVYDASNTSWTMVGSSIVGNVSLTGNLFVGPNNFTIRDLGNVALINNTLNGNISFFSNVNGTSTNSLHLNGISGLVEVAANAITNFGVTTKVYVDSSDANLNAAISSVSANVNALNANVAGLASNISIIQSGTGDINAQNLNAQKLSLNGNVVLDNSGVGNTIVNFKTPKGFTFLSAQGLSPTGSVVVYGNWTLGAGATLNSSYADLAEYYNSDDDYEPGTVLIFGGSAEVTITNMQNDVRLAGVVSENPAYVMNNNLEGKKVCMALQGKVPVKVVGKVKKGEMLTTSSIPGYAIAAEEPIIGSILGKSLADKDTDGPGLIDVSVMRF